MSRGKKFFLLTTLTLIALIAVGQLNHHADPGGPAGQGNGTVLNATKAATNNPLGITKVPLSATGMQTLANHVGHLAISINFTWLLLTGFLVLFMQVGFAFLVTGLTRAKNAGHMMMMNLVSFVVALMAYYAVGFAFQFGGVAPDRQSRRYVAPLNSIFGHGSAGVIGLHGFFLQSGNSYDVGVLAFFLFQVVFMETAGYIIIGAIAERISFAGFLFAEVAMGAIIYPIYGNWVWGGGWLATSASRSTSVTARSTSPGPVSSMRRAAGPRSRWRCCSDRASASTGRTERSVPSPGTTSATWSSARWS